MQAIYRTESSANAGGSLIYATEFYSKIKAILIKIFISPTHSSLICAWI